MARRGMAWRGRGSLRVPDPGTLILGRHGKAWQGWAWLGTARQGFSQGTRVGYPDSRQAGRGVAWQGHQNLNQLGEGNG